MVFYFIARHTDVKWVSQCRLDSNGENQYLPIAAKLATIDFARAFPTDNVVLGSLFGGGGGAA